MLSRMTAPAVLALALVAGCSQSTAENEPVAQGADSLEVPAVGACRYLEPEDLALDENSSPVVGCGREHTAETFAAGTFPRALARHAERDDPALGTYVYETCTERFHAFVGGDESTVLRSVLSWAWFKPSQSAWERGARWYRCDVVSGTEDSEQLRLLPRTARGLLLGRPDDAWMACALGETVDGSKKLPCSEPHTWRAVTTIKVGRDTDPYPGDRVVEVRTRDFCSDSVGAWLNYPVDYEFGYTYFREAEWEAGNRRSICWARTNK